MYRQQRQARNRRQGFKKSKYAPPYITWELVGVIGAVAQFKLSRPINDLLAVSVPPFYSTLQATTPIGVGYSSFTVDCTYPAPINNGDEFTMFEPSAAITSTLGAVLAPGAQLYTQANPIIPAAQQSSWTGATDFAGAIEVTFSFPDAASQTMSAENWDLNLAGTPPTQYRISGGLLNLTFPQAALPGDTLAYHDKLIQSTAATWVPAPVTVTLS